LSAHNDQVSSGLEQIADPEILYRSVDDCRDAVLMGGFDYHLYQRSEGSVHVPSPVRRLLLGAAGGLAAGAAAGLAGGVMMANAAQPRVVALAPNKRFADKVVVVTGATSGIGKAAVEAFAREGASVAFCGRREVLGHEVEDQIKRAGGKALYLRADVREEKDMAAFLDRVATTFGGVDIALTTQVSRSRSRCTSSRLANGTMSSTPICAVFFWR
jgi:NADPH:quinone reductase-like Zn-dependent oxidoreductase